MHYYKYPILLFCFLTLFNCEDEQKTIFSETNITTENNTIVEINIPLASGNLAISNQINTEIQKTIISALNIGSPNEINSSSIEESINSFNNEYTMFKTDFPETIQVWEAQIDGEVMYQSSEIISIAMTYYTNTGGAHGNLNISLLNFNSETGQRIENNQLFNDTEAFKALAKPYFEKATKDKSLLLDYKAFKLPANIGYNEEGIILLYNTYEIAPYSTGIIEFVVPFEVAQSYLVFNNF